MVKVQQRISMTPEEFESLMNQVKDKATTEEELDALIREFVFEKEYKKTLNQKVEFILNYFRESPFHNSNPLVINGELGIEITVYVWSIKLEEIVTIHDVIRNFFYCKISPFDEKLKIFFAENNLHKKNLKEISMEV